MKSVKRTIQRKAARTLSALLLVVAFLALESLAAPNPATENFTKIITAGQLGSGHPFFSNYVLNGPITITSPQHRRTTNTALTTAGLLDGEGTADFGTLKSRVLLQGPAALNGMSGSSFNDHWTVVNPSLTGTTGTMQLAFDLGGTATVLDTSGDPVASDAYSSVSLGVDLNPYSTGNGTRLLEYIAALGPGLTQIVATPNGPTVTVPFTFTYGVPFGIRVGLSVWAETDNTYLGTTFNPYFEYYGGGTIDSVTIDFLSTAELTAIVIPDDPSASVMGDSSVDYSDLVTTAVPLPATLWLLLAGIPALARTRRRTSR